MLGFMVLDDLLAKDCLPLKLHTEKIPLSLRICSGIALITCFYLNPWTEEEKKFPILRKVVFRKFSKSGKKDIQSYLSTHELQNSSNHVLIAFWWEKMFQHSALAQDSSHLLELVWVTTSTWKRKCFIVWCSLVSLLIDFSTQHKFPKELMTSTEVPLYIVVKHTHTREGQGKSPTDPTRKDIAI